MEYILEKILAKVDDSKKHAEEEIFNVDFKSFYRNSEPYKNPS